MEGMKWVIAGSILLMPVVNISAQANLAGKLRRVTGHSDVRMVWSLPEGGFTGIPVSSIALDQCLIRYDSRTDKVDTLLNEVKNYQRPMISRDGSSVVFTSFPAFSAVGTIYVVPFDGTAAPRRLARGAAACFWYDSTAQKEYVIYGYRCSMVENGDIFRVNLADSTDTAIVLKAPRDKPMVYEWLRVSSDLKYIVGAHNWFGVRIYRFSENSAEVVLEKTGLWTSMPYDATGRVLFTLENLKWYVCDTMGVYGILWIGRIAGSLQLASYSTRLACATFHTGKSGALGTVAVLRLDSTLTTIEDSVDLGWTHGRGCFPDLWCAPEPYTSGSRHRENHSNLYGYMPEVVPRTLYDIRGRELRRRVSGKTQTGPVLAVGPHGKVVVLNSRFR